MQIFFSFRILMPNNKIQHHYRHLNLHEPVKHVMIPCFPVIHPPPTGEVAANINNECLKIWYDPVAFTSSIVVVYAFITCCSPTPCIDGDRNPMHWWWSTRLAVVVVMSSHPLMMKTTSMILLDLKRRNENAKVQYALKHTSGNGFGVNNIFLKIFSKSNLMQCDLVYYRPKSRNHKALLGAKAKCHAGEVILLFWEFCLVPIQLFHSALMPKQTRAEMVLNGSTICS